MEKRLLLHQTLSAIPGVKQAWFQEPQDNLMEYPCILYKIDNEDVKSANNGPYSRTKRYMVTVIDPDPDSKIPDAVASLPMCRFSRRYVSDNLNHTAYTLFF